MADEAYSGEIWTDAHGFATVTLPSHSGGEFVVELEALADGVSAQLAAEPHRRRFTITTSEPHVKVAWRAGTRPTSIATRSPRRFT
jgi:hypothetical protein